MTKDLFRRMPVDEEAYDCTRCPLCVCAQFELIIYMCCFCSFQAEELRMLFAEPIDDFWEEAGCLHGIVPYLVFRSFNPTGRLARIRHLDEGLQSPTIASQLADGLVLTARSHGA